MSEIRLKPCPFCGATLRRNCLGNGEHDKDDCILAALEIPVKYFPIWNTRIPMQEIVERVSRLDLDGLKMLEDDKYELIRKKEVLEIVKEVGGMNGKIDRHGHILRSSRM